METKKMPRANIKGVNVFPSSIVEVATAVPAFIGYTQSAVKDNLSVLFKPTRVTSMAEFQNIFGVSPTHQFDLVEAAGPAQADLSLGDKHYSVNRKGDVYRLYQSMQLFYFNGGGPCYIVSIGGYDQGMNKMQMTQGIDALIEEHEPTLVVIPDAVSLAAPDCYTVQQAMLMHCGSKMRNRFAILDIHDGYRNKVDSVLAFRNAVPNKEVGSFGAAYYPWLNTTLLSDSDVNYEFLSPNGRTRLQELLTEVFATPTSDLALMIAALTAEGGPDSATPAPHEIDKVLRANSQIYPAILNEIKVQLNMLPPSGAMAGLFTMVDNTRGVWNAPANIGVMAVSSPALEISHDEQEALNIDNNGKSVNAIRAFNGEGTLVWGARTLDGNSQDWRYIHVRRTLIMLEQSIKLATKAYVSEPNNAQTWQTLKSMISNYLVGIWKRGGLAGSTPDDAFSVHVGLGETMTSEDILGSILRISVQVAITRSAEFVEIYFQQQMQES
jgi:phage tail sheath protein FI